MHRVELKAESPHYTNKEEGVPNAPCGVESWYGDVVKGGYFLVPNAPCGVESPAFISVSTINEAFLMHRVELKE